MSLQFQGQMGLTTYAGDTGIIITLDDLTVVDSDSIYPDDFRLRILDGNNYTRTYTIYYGMRITPATGFSGELSVPMIVNDGTNDSNTFNFKILVKAPTYTVIGGDEFQVNDIDDRFIEQHDHPAITNLNDGSFFVTWSNKVDDYYGWNHHEITGKLFSNSGDAMGEQLSIDNISGYNINDDVATLSNGNIVSVWSNISGSVYCKVITPSGEAITGDMNIKRTFYGYEQNASVASLTSGGFIVVWQHFTGFIDYKFNVYGQVFDNMGNEIPGSAFDIEDSFFPPSIASLQNNRVIVVWSSPINSGGNIHGRILDSTGATVTDIPDIKSFMGKGNVLGLSNGNFVITWGVYGQIFNGTGTKAGNKFIITDTANRIVSQVKHSMASSPNGGFVIVWEQRTSALNSSIFGKEFYSNGNASAKFIVNTSTDREDNSPAVTYLSNGNFVVSWRSEEYDGYRVTRDIISRIFF